MAKRHTEPERISKARSVMLRNAANRAVDDPVKLARAVRVVQAALERGVLTADELAEAEK